MSEQPPAFASNRARMEYVFAETAKGNGRPFLDALAEDACWTIIGSTAWSKTYRGKSAILNELIAPLRRVLAPPLRTHAHRMTAEAISWWSRGAAKMSLATGSPMRTAIAGYSRFATTTLPP
jgi:ketosteroid isomerase-like protein